MGPLCLWQCFFNGVVQRLFFFVSGLMALLFLRCFYYLSGCDEFTVDSCRPDPSQIINAGYLPNRYDQNDKEGTCQNFCDRQTDCTYWSVYCPRTPGSEHCNCTLYGHSYLHSCQKVGGDKDTAIEVSLMGDHFQKVKGRHTFSKLTEHVFQTKKLRKSKSKLRQENFTTMRK